LIKLRKLMAKNLKSTKLVAAMLSWFAANARDLPWRRTRDPYAIWVSEIMLQQTQVKTVIPYWERWLRELPNIAALAAAAPEKIHKLWEGLGYYTRVRNLQKAAQQIVADHAGKFPRDFDAVLALPGVGRYTAGAICSIAYNQPTPILDGNVIRILTRIFGIAGDPREKTTNAQLWKLAGELVVCAARLDSPSSGCCSAFNQSMMELGALICTPRQPQCEICPVKKLCVARRENRVAELPNLAKRAAATERRYAAFIVERDGKFLVRQRPAGVVNAHLWEFPNEEIAAPADSLHFSAPRNAKPFCTIRHSITRYRITLEAWPAKLAGKAAAGVWLTPAQLDRLAFTSAHRKVLEHLNRSRSNCVQESKPQPRIKS
jgi:A/G-specific adenine glycosylase